MFPGFPLSKTCWVFSVFRSCRRPSSSAASRARNCDLVYAWMKGLIWMPSRLIQIFIDWIHSPPPSPLSPKTLKPTVMNCKMSNCFVPKNRAVSFLLDIITETFNLLQTKHGLRWATISINCAFVRSCRNRPCKFRLFGVPKHRNCRQCNGWNALQPNYLVEVLSSYWTSLGHDSCFGQDCNVCGETIHSTQKQNGIFEYFKSNWLDFFRAEPDRIFNWFNDVGALHCKRRNVWKLEINMVRFLCWIRWLPVLCPKNSICSSCCTPSLSIYRHFDEFQWQKQNRCSLEEHSGSAAYHRVSARAFKSLSPRSFAQSLHF